MIEWLIIGLASLLVSLLTFFAGFGLGTLLMPVFAIFFPVDVAVALTAVVHFLNNIFKLVLTGRNANWGVVLRFGVPAIIAALPGAWLLLHISSFEPLFTYQMGDRLFAVTPVKLLIAVLLVFSLLLEALPG